MNIRISLVLDSLNEKKELHSHLQQPLKTLGQISKPRSARYQREKNSFFSIFVTFLFYFFRLKHGIGKKLAGFWEADNSMNLLRFKRRWSDRRLRFLRCCSWR